MRATPPDWSFEKVTWRQDLSALMSRLEAWVTDSQLEDKLHVEKRDLEILEDELGPYVVISLTIVVRTRHPRKVLITPRAMQVVGGICVEEALHALSGLRAEHDEPQEQILGQAPG